MLRGEIPAVMRSSSLLLLMNFSLLLTWQHVIITLMVKIINRTNLLLNSVFVMLLLLIS